MPFNGVGLFQRVYQWVNDAALGLNVDATRTDTDSNDIAAGLSNCVTRDGQSPWLANLPTAGFKLTGLPAGMNAADSVNFDQVFNSPSFVTPSATTSPVLGDNSLRLATTAFVVQQAFSVALPAQPGDAVPRALFTVNGVASWKALPLVRVPRTANTAIDGTNNGNLIDITANTFTQTFAAIASAPPNFYCYLQNSGSGDITLDPNGAETVDALASYVMYPGEVRLLYKDETGLLWKTIKLRNFYRSVTSNFTYIHPPGYDLVESDQVAGGGGGGSGRRDANGNKRNGGAPGGTPSRVITRHRNLVAGNSYPVVIGANGTGGAAVTVDSTDGTAGTAGGNNTFNGITSFGGVAGLGGRIATYNHTSGSGSLSVGACLNNQNSSSIPADVAFGGLPSLWKLFSAVLMLDAIGDGGASSIGAFAGGSSVYGGAASGSNSLNGTAVLTTGSHSQFGVPAAGQGGWITDVDTVPATAGYAGLRGTWTGTGTPGGTCGAVPTAGANGTAATNDNECGTSGSGGGSSIAVAAAAGGNGGFPGGAGGGGGASLNGKNSGKGGDGQPGRTILKGI